MTTATDAPGTALAQVAPGALALAMGNKRFTIGDLVDLLGRQPAAPVPVTKEPFPKPAPVVQMTDALTGALGAMPVLFGKLQVTERRVLTAAEIKQLTDETIAINLVGDQIGKRKEAIALAMRHHADCRAEADYLAHPYSVTRGGKLIHEATPRVGAGKAAGHYALATPGNPVEIPVEGYQDPWRIQYTSGSSGMAGRKLDDLLAEEKITRAEYLSFTRQVRVLDDGKIAEALKANPGRTLEIMAAITETGQAGASTYSPKK